MAQIFTPKNSRSRAMTLGEFREITKDISDDAKLYVDCIETGWGPCFPNNNLRELAVSKKSLTFRTYIKHSRY